MTRGTTPGHLSLRPLLAALACLALLRCGSDGAAQQQPAPVPDAGASDAPLADGPAQGDAPHEAALVPAFTFATFNVRLFFDTTCDSGNCAAGDFETVVTQKQLDDRADQIAAAIRGFKAAAVSVQEIETNASMQALSSRLADLYPAAVFGETGAAGSLDVAIFSEGTVLAIRKHRGVPITRPDGTSTWFAREFLEVHIDWKGTRLVLFTAHFRSKNNDDPGRREAEALAARDIILATAAEFPDAVVLLGGDLNDTPGSPPLLHLENASGLLRVASDRPLEEVSTYTWNGELHAIDHIFLATGSRGVYVPGSARALRDAPGQGLAGSDHAALGADFALR